MTGWTARAIATELVEERVSGDADVDVTTAVLETLCARHARATPSDVVIGLNLEASDEHASTTTAAVTTSGGHSRAYTDEGKRLLKSYVVAFPSVVRAFEATAFVDVRDGSTRCSKFARGLDEETIAAVRDWRGKNLGAKLLALDADANVVVGGGARRAGGKKTREGGRKSNKERGSREVAAPPKVVLVPAPPPAVPAWGGVKSAQPGSSSPSSGVPRSSESSAVGTSLRDIMEGESRRFQDSAQGRREESATTKASVPQLPIITAELLRSESRRSVMDKFGKVKCQVCGRSFKTYDALEQHIGASHYGLNNPYAKVLETAQIAAGLVAVGKEKEAKRVSLKLGDLVSSKTKTSNSMVTSLAAYFKTEKQTAKRVDKKDGIAHGGVMIKSTNTASSTGVVLRRGKEREKGKKKRHSTLKKIILRERSIKKEGANAVEEEVEVEIEVRVGWVYVQVDYEGDETVKVNLMCMDEGDEGSASSDTDADVVDDETMDGAPAGEDAAIVKEKIDTIEARVPAGVWGVQSLVDVLKGKTDNAKRKPRKVKEETKTCDICNVPCYGVRAWKEHIEGKSHKKAVEIMSDPVRAAARNKPPITYVGTDAKQVRYAQQTITDELNAATTSMLVKLKGFQDRLYHQDKIKAKMRRRLLYGLREVAKSVDAKTSKAVVIAPNIEQIESEGGLDDRINAIIKDAKENEIPIVFALTKKRIGRALRMKEISVVSVLDYSGADEEFKSTLKHAAEGRELYAKTLRA
jgi:selenocysteine insertion sequence-binding protein 2